MTIKQISFYAEKLVFILYISLLLLQIFLSVKDYRRHEYVDTRVEEQLFKVDLPMIILCAEKPHKDGLTISHDEQFYMGFNQKGKNFVGWATENMSTIENLKSRARVNNISDLLDHAWISKNVWSRGKRGRMLEVQQLRIMHQDGQCFTLRISKEEIRKELLENENFVVALAFKIDVSFKIYLTDPNTYNGYNIPVERKLARSLNDGNYKIFDVSVAQVERNSDDPSVACERYETTYGYFDCVTERAEKKFSSLIGCVPPWFTDDEGKMCQKKDTDFVNDTLQALLQDEEAEPEYGKLMLGRLPLDLFRYFDFFLWEGVKNGIFMT